MPDSLSFQNTSPDDFAPHTPAEPPRAASTSLRELGQAVWRRRRLIAVIETALLLLCLLYCLIAPNQYEANARVELRTAPASSLTLEAQQPFAAASVLSAPMALETLASVLRSDRLAWRVIVGLKLYQQEGFRGRFLQRFPDFNPDKPTPGAEAWLLEHFSSRLHVETVPHTLLIEIRFRTHDAVLSAAVVNALIRAFQEQEAESQIQATAQASGWLNAQLADLKVRVDRDQQRLADFEAQHGIVSTPEVQANGQPGETEHAAALMEIDELSRQLVAATTDRILSEAEYRAASQGDPEMVIAANPGLQAQNANFATALLEQIHARRSDLEQEQAQLSAEHGPSFPRVVEIGRQLKDLDRQKQAEDTKLVARFRSSWQTALDREQMVRNSLQQVTGEGIKLNEATTEYAVMRQEANASHDLYVRVLEKSEEAGLAAGVHSSNISVVDAARQPVKPVAPNPPLYLAITFFAGLWIAVGAALLRESLANPAKRAATALLALLAAGACLHAQAPSPNTSGLPSGVVNIPQTQENRSLPNPKEAPTIWNNAGSAGAPPVAAAPSSSTMPAPIASGDFLDISEYHTPEFHSSVRVSAGGTAMLPMIGEINISGMDEQAAAHAIEAALLARGMLLHPLVSVLVTSYVGQDVSVLGEVTHPGVYPFTYHHRLLDLISAASGLSSNAGRLVNVFHSSDPKTPHPVILDPSGTDTASDHNPELTPGDTVQVSRAGLVYVVGDVIRPGGFPVDPAQGLTVVQALSLAWGPSLNAAVGHALLIREQKGGRTMIALNLRRMLHGQDPDQPIQDRDILYVPDSFAKNLANRTMESAIQSAIGVTIYSALVYSQRY
ncbi:MAG: SLBB domain-containing protein [Terracidiphilus sp.]|nr:SLBB domain-containing protein [Terracidiphilus sp.]